MSVQDREAQEAADALDALSSPTPSEAFRAVRRFSVRPVLGALYSLLQGGPPGSLPDPSGEDDGEVLTVDSGSAVWAPPGGSSSYTGPFTIYGLKWQAIDASGDIPDAGTLTLAYDGVDADPINATDDATAAQAALEAVPALAGKIVSVTGGLGAGNGGILYIELDDSLAPFAAFTISDNALTASAAPVADPLSYVAVSGGQVQIVLMTPLADSLFRDWLLDAIPEAFGSESEVYLSPASGDADWPQGSALRLDVADGSDNWGISNSADSAQYFRSAAQSMAANFFNDTGYYPTLPCKVKVASAIQANLTLAGQGTGGVAEIVLDLPTVTAPS